MMAILASCWNFRFVLSQANIQEFLYNLRSRISITTVFLIRSSSAVLANPEVTIKCSGSEDLISKILKGEGSVDQSINKYLKATKTLEALLNENYPEKNKSL